MIPPGQMGRNDWCQQRLGGIIAANTRTVRRGRPWRAISKAVGQAVTALIRVSARIERRSEAVHPRLSKVHFALEVNISIAYPEVRG